MPALFTNGEAMLWLIIALIATFVVVYFPLYLFYLNICRLDGPLSIRIAWTVGIVILLLYLTLLSPLHAPYLAFWQGGEIVSFLLVAGVLFLFLLVLWIKRPQMN